MQRRVISQLQRVISVSTASATDVERAFALPTGRVHSVPIGVDTQVFAPRPQIQREPGRLVAITSADIPLKGLLQLLEAVAKVQVERDVTLVVVGRSHAETDAVIDRLGLAAAVRFEAGVSTQRLTELFAQAEVAVVPSLYEGFSLPAVEAMACGVPLVATTGGALPEVVGPDGGTGLLVEPGDSQALAQAILRLLNDDALRAAMGARGRRRATTRFTWRQAAVRTLAHYQALHCQGLGEEGRRDADR